MNARMALRTTAVSLALTALFLVVLGCSSEDGEQLYVQSCQSCHGDAATGAGRLTALIPAHGPSGHTWHHADGQLVDIVLGRFTYPGREMPSFAGTLSEEQVESIIAYIKVGWNEEMREYQAEVSRGWKELNQ